ncbi:MAG: hypothetical protein JWN98_167, partial [Abditibacteriota bacterium]|nr:hypothetical protein [Abditibacteriota bacterium]
MSDCGLIRRTFPAHTPHAREESNRSAYHQYAHALFDEVTRLDDAEFDTETLNDAAPTASEAKDEAPEVEAPTVEKLKQEAVSMSMSFQKATKRSARLRMALIGVAGAGKTYTALNIAKHLGGSVAVIDTERGSASKYSDMFDFDVLELEVFSPQMYVDAIQAAEEAGYEVLVIDSLSHAWTGKGGALEQVDRSAKRSQSGNTFGAWRNVTPLHNAMVDAIINTKMHVITTMRAKSGYVQEKDEKTGMVTVRKVGLAPVQRDGLE